MTTGGAQVAPCRLLFVVGQMHTGGLERQLVYLLTALDRSRYNPAIVVWNYSETDVRVPEVRALGVPLYVPVGAPTGVAKVKALRHLVKQLRPEVVHSYTFYTNIAAHIAAYGTGALAVGSVRSDFAWGIRDAGPLLGRLSARWPRYQISNSFSAADAAEKAPRPFAPKRCQVVWNGVDLAQFPAVDLPVGPVEIVGLGYLLPVKRWDRLINVAAVLKQRGLHCRINIVGDGPLRDPLEARTRELGVADCVRFLPHTNDVAGALARASLLVLSSDNEGCPNVVMEAMACGRAVVATAVGDVPILVEEGNTGFVVPASDQELLADRVATLVGDRELCRRMGMNARRTAERAFGLDRLAKDTLAAYRDAGWRERVRPAIVLPQAVPE